MQATMRVAPRFACLLILLVASLPSAFAYVNGPFTIALPTAALYSFDNTGTCVFKVVDSQLCIYNKPSEKVDYCLYPSQTGSTCSVDTLNLALLPTGQMQLISSQYPNYPVHSLLGKVPPAYADVWYNYAHISAHMQLDTNTNMCYLLVARGGYVVQHFKFWTDYNNYQVVHELVSNGAESSFFFPLRYSDNDYFRGVNWNILAHPNCVSFVRMHGDGTFCLYRTYLTICEREYINLIYKITTEPSPAPVWCSRQRYVQPQSHVTDLALQLTPNAVLQVAANGITYWYSITQNQRYGGANVASRLLFDDDGLGIKVVADDLDKTVLWSSRAEARGVYPVEGPFNKSIEEAKTADFDQQQQCTLRVIQSQVCVFNSVTRVSDYCMYRSGNARNLDVTSLRLVATRSGAIQLRSTKYAYAVHAFPMVSPNAQAWSATTWMVEMVLDTVTSRCYLAARSISVSPLLMQVAYYTFFSQETTSLVSSLDSTTRNTFQQYVVTKRPNIELMQVNWNVLANADCSSFVLLHGDGTFCLYRSGLGSCAGDALLNFILRSAALSATSLWCSTQKPPIVEPNIATMVLSLSENGVLQLVDTASSIVYWKSLRAVATGTHTRLVFDADGQGISVVKDDGSLVWGSARDAYVYPIRGPFRLGAAQLVNTQFDYGGVCWFRVASGTNQLCIYNTATQRNDYCLYPSAGASSVNPSSLTLEALPNGMLQLVSTEYVGYPVHAFAMKAPPSGNDLLSVDWFVELSYEEAHSRCYLAVHTSNTQPFLFMVAHFTFSNIDQYAIVNSITSAALYVPQLADVREITSNAQATAVNKWTLLANADCSSFVVVHADATFCLYRSGLTSCANQALLNFITRTPLPSAVWCSTQCKNVVPTTAANVNNFALQMGTDRVLRLIDRFTDVVYWTSTPPDIATDVLPARLSTRAATLVFDNDGLGISIVLNDAGASVVWQSRVDSMFEYDYHCAPSAWNQDILSTVFDCGTTWLSLPPSQPLPSHLRAFVLRDAVWLRQLNTSLAAANQSRVDKDGVPLLLSRTLNVVINKFALLPANGARFISAIERMHNPRFLCASNIDCVGVASTAEDWKQFVYLTDNPRLGVALPAISDFHLLSRTQGYNCNGTLQTRRTLRDYLDVNWYIANSYNRSYVRPLAQRSEEFRRMWAQQDFASRGFLLRQSPNALCKLSPTFHTTQSKCKQTAGTCVEYCSTSSTSTYLSTLNFPSKGFCSDIVDVNGITPSCECVYDTADGRYSPGAPRKYCGTSCERPMLDTCRSANTTSLCNGQGVCSCQADEPYSELFPGLLTTKGACTCNAPFAGTYCTTSYSGCGPADNLCSGHGSCQTKNGGSSFGCVCDVGYLNTSSCDVSAAPCTKPGDLYPCRSRGLCSLDSSTAQVSCKCQNDPLTGSFQQPYLGRYCEVLGCSVWPSNGYCLVTYTSPGEAFFQSSTVCFPAFTSAQCMVSRCKYSTLLQGTYCGCQPNTPLSTYNNTYTVSTDPTGGATTQGRLTVCHTTCPLAQLPDGTVAVCGSQETILGDYNGVAATSTYCNEANTVDIVASTCVCGSGYIRNRTAWGDTCIPACQYGFVDTYNAYRWMQDYNCNSAGTCTLSSAFQSGVYCKRAPTTLPPLQTSPPTTKAATTAAATATSTSPPTTARPSTSASPTAATTATSTTATPIVTTRQPTTATPTTQQPTTAAALPSTAAVVPTTASATTTASPTTTEPTTARPTTTRTPTTRTPTVSTTTAATPPPSPSSSDSADIDIPLIAGATAGGAGVLFLFCCVMRMRAKQRTHRRRRLRRHSDDDESEEEENQHSDSDDE